MITPPAKYRREDKKVTTCGVTLYSGHKNVGFVEKAIVHPTDECKVAFLWGSKWVEGPMHIEDSGFYVNLSETSYLYPIRATT